MNDDINKFDGREELFRRYIDGELSSEEEREVLHLIADDEDMREMLRFERSLILSFAELQDPGSFSVPEHFGSSVMDRIEKTGRTTELAEAPVRKRAPVFSLFKNRTMTINPALAAAAMILITFGFGYLLLNGTAPVIDGTNSVDGQEQIQTISESAEKSQIWIRFIYFDETAESIEIAGDFNNWEPTELTLETMGDRQVWTGLIPLTRGEHKYMFVRNGEEWVTDPLAEVQKDDGFGNKNAVLYL